MLCLTGLHVFSPARLRDPMGSLLRYPSGRVAMLCLTSLHVFSTTRLRESHGVSHGTTLGVSPGAPHGYSGIWYIP